MEKVSFSYQIPNVTSTWGCIKSQKDHPTLFVPLVIEISSNIWQLILLYYMFLKIYIVNFTKWTCLLKIISEKFNLVNWGKFFTLSLFSQTFRLDKISLVTKFGLISRIASRSDYSCSCGCSLSCNSEDLGS